jgi:thiamine-phosphate diphosphorylase
VHLGPDDPPVKDVRRVADARAVTGTRAVDADALSGVADTFIVGYSTDTTDEAARAEAEGADYLGVGAVYATANKSDAGDVIGLEGLRRVVKAVSIPVVAIGGITPERAPAVAKAGACGSAAIGAVMSAAEPAEAVRELLLPFGGTP